MELNIDSVMVVEVILKGASESYEEQALTHHIIRLIGMHENVKDSHTFRETNKCTDALVNEDYKLQDICINFSVASNFLNTFLEDGFLEGYFAKLIAV